ncbi:MAG TPA: hypothetical protein VHW00_20020 [Thermoanaerobaculia bacterium]|nr:hypothetical protein [Thermoanaerobaculia bacterium]
MNDATFFRNPSADTGDTYAFRLKAEEEEYRFFVYSRRRISSANFTDRETDRKEVQALQKDVTNILRSHGGGIMVLVWGAGLNQRVEVKTVNGTAIAAPSTCTILPPGRSPYPLKIDGPQRIDAGAHLIVPIDQESETQLQSVLNLLKWFSPDFESLVLNAMRRPSLDVRINKVEREMFGRTSAEAQTEDSLRGWKRLKARGRRLFTNPALYGWSAALLLLILLTVNAMLMRRFEKRLPIDKTTAAIVVKAPIKKAGVHTAATNPPTLAARTRELLAAMRRRTKPDDDLRILYETHFRSSDKAGIKDAAIVQLFNATRPGDESTNRTFLIGLLKLQALQLKPILDNNNFLRNPAMTGTVTAIRTADAWQKNETAVALMSAIACRLGYSNEGHPALLTDASRPPDFFLAQKMTCGDYNDQHILAGMEPLIKFAQTP